MADITPIRQSPRSLIKPTMRDTQGANGWEWRMVWLLRSLAGANAVDYATAFAPEERELYQFRERLLDQIADRIAQELPEIRNDTPEQLAARRPTAAGGDK